MTSIFHFEFDSHELELLAGSVVKTVESHVEELKQALSSPLGALEGDLRALASRIDEAKAALGSAPAPAAEAPAEPAPEEQPTQALPVVAPEAQPEAPAEAQ